MDKKEAIDWAELNLVGKSIYCNCIDKDIKFTRQGCKHAIGSKLNPMKINLIYISEELIKKSILFKSENDKLKRKDIKKVHTLISNYNIKDKKYKIYIIVREGVNGNIYYDHNAVKIKEI